MSESEEPRRKRESSLSMTKQQQDTLKTLSLVLGMVALVAGAAFVMGNYPTRGEWDSARDKTAEEIEQIKQNAAKVHVEQVRLRSSMDAIEKSQARSEKTQEEINKKLDAAISGNRRR